MKTEWIKYSSYQKSFNNVKAMIKEDTGMNFYNEFRPLYLETDASRIDLGAELLQTRDGTNCSQDKTPDNSLLRPVTFTSKSLSSTERRYRNIERESLGILHRLEKFHH